MNDQAVILVESRRFGDERGWFMETYARAKWAAVGIDIAFVQDNHSYSAQVGTIRGVHFQRAPHAQAKLIRCVRGAIRDYAVDLRAGSPTFGRHVSVELSAGDGRQLLVPVGFGHAFVTLQPDTEVEYKVSDVYAPNDEGGVRWDCPDLAIDWPLPPGGPTLSGRDQTLPGLAELDADFTYNGHPLAGIERRTP